MSNSSVSHTRTLWNWLSALVLDVKLKVKIQHGETCWQVCLLCPSKSHLMKNTIVVQLDSLNRKP